jgi:hypothetical protein
MNTNKLIMIDITDDESDNFPIATVIGYDMDVFHSNQHSKSKLSKYK